MTDANGRVVLRDHEGWMLLASIGLLGATPILMGLDKIVFMTGAALHRVDFAGEVAGILFALGGILLLFTAHFRNVQLWRLARKHDRENAPFFRNRQVHFTAVTVLCWWLVATLNRLEQQNSEAFLGAAAGVLTGLILLFTLDSRFMPRHVVDED